MMSIYGAMSSVLHGPIKGESQKRAVVLHNDHEMMVAKGFGDSGLLPFLNKNFLHKTGRRNKVLQSPWFSWRCWALF